MPTSTIILAYFALLGGALLAVGFFHQQRQRRFGPTRSKDNVFRCRKCSLVYTDDADVDRSRCPQCGDTNDVCSF